MIRRIPSQVIIAGAANIKGGDNPPFSVADFKEIYPQFWDSDELPLVPLAVMEMYIAFADSFVKISRYHKAWQVCMSLVIAHFLVLYLRTMNADPDSGAAGVIKAAETKGLVASKSVDGVSVSYDFSTALSDLDGWADWKTTEYGIQFITYAKNYMRGGMMVW
ncbi:MAG: DUF4054 domain-containing protein [Lacrimispora sphenoides]